MFSRITPASVARLFKTGISEESIFNVPIETEDKENDWETASVISEAPSVANSIITISEESCKPLDSEFLILDMRDHESFETAHIREAIHCPLQMLTSARYAATLYSYKATPGKFVIVYAWDERPGV
jgi:hypothetical protein